MFFKGKLRERKDIFLQIFYLIVYGSKGRAKKQEEWIMSWIKFRLDSIIEFMFKQSHALNALVLKLVKLDEFLDEFLLFLTKNPENRFNGYK